MFLCTSKSKYGIKYEEAGSMVDEKLQDSGKEREKSGIVEWKTILTKCFLEFNDFHEFKAKV